MVEVKEPLLAELYHENTKTKRYDRDEALRSHRISRDPRLQKSLLHCFKEYAGSPVTDLPQTLPSISMSFRDIMDQRRSVRSFNGRAVSLQQLAGMLWCGSGITGEFRDDAGELLRYLRTTPSAGALYPVENYVISFAVDDLEKGLYHYNVKNHQLECLQTGDMLRYFRAPFYQEEIYQGAAGVILLTAVFRRTMFKYGERGYRYVLLEIGHVAQNIISAATAFDLGTVAICGYVDAEMDQLLDVDGVEESTVYLIAFGHGTD